MCRYQTIRALNICSVGYSMRLCSHQMACGSIEEDLSSGQLSGTQFVFESHQLQTVVSPTLQLCLEVEQ